VRRSRRWRYCENMAAAPFLPLSTSTSTTTAISTRPACNPSARLCTPRDRLYAPECSNFARTAPAPRRDPGEPPACAACAACAASAPGLHPLPHHPQRAHQLLRHLYTRFNTAFDCPQWLPAFASSRPPTAKRAPSAFPPPPPPPSPSPQHPPPSPSCRPARPQSQNALSAPSRRSSSGCSPPRRSSR
jgi:hypothetical protein